MFGIFKKLYYRWKYRNCNQKTSFFTMKNVKVWAKIVHVYDGDTVHAVFKHPGTSKIYKYKIRLAHIDTPELNSKNSKEVVKALAAKKVVEEKILNKIVYLEIDGEDKYGRLLGNIFIDGLNLNEYLVNKKHAYKYEGGTKKTWN
jgi:micrococcal nuclease